MGCDGGGPALGTSSDPGFNLGAIHYAGEMGVIRLLDEALASQIAAGEVVERPASVAKELLENAVDAGATVVEIYASQGGVERLTVVDDGRGMTPEDAALAFSRHATSKLKTIDDLRALGTFGFRGEALAAIASVSRVRLVTRPPDAATGFEVRVAGGRIVHVGECEGAFGTRVDVRDLFFNVPARRKFLKTSRTEAGHIEAVVRDLGLFRPGLALRMDAEGRRSLDLAQASETAALGDPRRIERISQCLGGNLRDDLLPFDEKTDLLHVRGYVVPPLEARRDTSGMHLAVNGRPVADRGLVQALRLAFRPLLEVGRHPICALDLELDPALVDVNVHPRKAEVRFDDPRRVHGHLIRLVSDFLAKAPWRKPGPVKPYRLGGARPTAAGAAEQPEGSSPVDASDDPAALHRARVKEALARFQSRVQGRRGSFGDGGRGPAEAHGALRRPVDEVRVLGAVAGTWVLAADRTGLVVLDRQGAAERLAELRMRAALMDGEVGGQPMLFPLRFDLTPIEAVALEERGEHLKRCGLDVELFGEGVGLCRALPRELDAGRAEEIARTALELLSEGRPEPGSAAFFDEMCRRLGAFARPPADDAGLLREALALDDEGRSPVLRRFGPDDLAAWFTRHET